MNDEKITIYHSDVMTDEGLFEALVDCMKYVYATDAKKAQDVIFDICEYRTKYLMDNNPELLKLLCGF